MFSCHTSYSIIGVILSTAFCHLLQDAFESLTKPDVQKRYNNIGRWTGLIMCAHCVSHVDRSLTVWTIVLARSFSYSSSNVHAVPCIVAYVLTARSRHINGIRRLPAEHSAHLNSVRRAVAATHKRPHTRHHTTSRAWRKTDVRASASASRRTLSLTIAFRFAFTSLVNDCAPGFHQRDAELPSPERLGPPIIT